MTIQSDNFFLLDSKLVKSIQRIQNLWGGYGTLSRYFLNNEKYKSVIVKEIQFPSLEKSHHPRGWNTKQSHERKKKSYQVEWEWYRTFAKHCSKACRLADCYTTIEKEEKQILVLEDLDASGFPIRKDHLSYLELKTCLKWLANFHATFMGEEPKGLWEVGTYWHFDTRPDEFEKMENGWLKESASYIDEQLNQAHYQTLVHGDAKVANFCFSENLQKVVAVDFQYVGGGCGMKDVIYLMSSCLSANDCKIHEEAILEYYFKLLQNALREQNKKLDFERLEKEWRRLYFFAWADFYRFLKGWAANHHKLNLYREERLKAHILK